MLNISLEHTVVTFNGHRVQGWAPGDDALQMPNIKLIEYDFGPDGLLSAGSTGMKGGPVVLKLQGNSPSTAFFFRQIAAVLRGAVINWEGAIENRQAGTRIIMAAGLLDEVPLGQSLGNAKPPAREFTFIFQQIIPNYDGAITQAPPVLAI